MPSRSRMKIPKIHHELVVRIFRSSARIKRSLPCGSTGALGAIGAAAVSTLI